LVVWAAACTKGELIISEAISAAFSYACFAIIVREIQSFNKLAGFILHQDEAE